MKKLRFMKSWITKHLWSMAIFAMLLVLALSPIQVKASSEELTPEILKERLEALKLQYPSGKYWNHVGSEELNLEGTTDTPCQYHDLHGTTCNYFEYNGQKFWCCAGFASILSVKLYGEHYTERPTSTNIEVVKPGDVIGYGNNGMGAGHEITVLGICGETIRVVDCNTGGTCQIDWENEKYTETVDYKMNEGIYKGRRVNRIHVAPMALPYEDGYCGEASAYELGEDGTLTISGTGGVDNHFFENNAEIKKVVIGEGITDLGLLTFANCPNLEEVVFADSVEVIYNKCFAGCGALTKCNVPDKLRRLGEEAFKNTGLTEFVIPEGTQKVGDNVFRGCPGFCGNACHYVNEEGVLRVWGSGSIYEGFFAWSKDFRKVIIEDGVTVVGKRSFASCDALEEVILPDGMESILEKAFENCYELSKINVPSALKLIGEEAFINNAFSNFDFPEEMVSAGANVFMNCPTFCGNESHYALENGILRITGTGIIYECMFSGDEDNSWDIVEAYVGEGITEIGYAAFWYCDQMRYLSLPSTLTKIYDNTFYHCISLRDVDCHADPLKMSVANSYITTKEQFITEPERGTTFHVPEDWEDFWWLKMGDVILVQYVGDLPTSTKAPEIVETGECGYSGAAVFYTLWTDGTLIIEGSGSIKSEAFSALDNQNFKIVKNVVIRDGIDWIQYGAFRGCVNIRAITLPRTLMQIGSEAFFGCDRLKDVYCYADVSRFHGWSYEYDRHFPADQDVTCHVVEEDLSAWQSLEGFSEEVSFVGDLEPAEAYDVRKGRCGKDAYYEIDETGCLRIYGEGKIFDNFFPRDKYYLGNVTKFSFKSMGINKVVIEEGITEIGVSEFQGFDGITEVVLPDSLQKIGSEAFYECTALRAVTIPENMVRIDARVFSKCRSITEFQCLANPQNLTWGESDYDFITNKFEGGKITICHVPSNYLKGYQEKLGKVNVTFRGDLAPNLKEITFEAVKGREETCSKDGNLAYYLGSDGQIYLSEEGILLTDRNEDGVVDLSDVILPATGHLYEGENSILWCWEKSGEDFSVTACLKCMNCGVLAESVPASVEETEGAAGVTYVATATVEGAEVSMTREIRNEYYVTIDGTSSTHAFGDQVTAWAAAPSEGMAFAGWYEGDTLVCTSLEIEFLVSRNVALHTVYVDAAQYVEPAEPILNFDLSERVFDENGNQKLDMTVTWCLSDGMSVKDVGLVRTTDAEAELIIDNEEVKKRSAGVDNQSGTFIHHLTLGEISGALTAYAKAYLVYDDGQGEEHVLYTERQLSAPAVRADEAAQPAENAERAQAAEGNAAETAQSAENAEGTQAAGGNAAETAQPAEGTGEAQPTEE